MPAAACAWQHGRLNRGPLAPSPRLVFGFRVALVLFLRRLRIGEPSSLLVPFRAFHPAGSTSYVLCLIVLCCVVPCCAPSAAPSGRARTLFETPEQRQRMPERQRGRLTGQRHEGRGNHGAFVACATGLARREVGWHFEKVVTAVRQHEIFGEEIPLPRHALTGPGWPATPTVAFEGMHSHAHTSKQASTLATLKPAMTPCRGDRHRASCFVTLSQGGRGARPRHLHAGSAKP